MNQYHSSPSSLKSFFQVALAVLLGALAVSGAHASSLVINGGFETPVVSGDQVLYHSGSNIGGWVVSSGSVKHTGSTWLAAEGSQSLELNGCGCGSVYQDLSTVAGSTYNLSFSLAGNPFGYADKSMKVKWGGVEIASLIFDQTGTSTASMGWLAQNFLVTAASATTRLEFISLTGAMNGSRGYGSYYGPVIDGVSVSMVPVPAAVWLFGSGLLGLVSIARRKTQKA